MPPIYHITHMENLPEILKAGGLACDSTMATLEVSPVCIAHSHIKERRAKKGVPVAPGGVVADYVPFYFTNRCPMLYAIHTGYVDGYDGGQGEVIHLVSSVETVAKHTDDWCFTDGHAVQAMTEFFENVEHLDRVDWDVIKSNSWYDRPSDLDRKRRKQAEFLVYKFFPWHWIKSIGVLNPNARAKVQNMLQAQQYCPPVAVKAAWYY